MSYVVESGSSRRARRRRRTAITLLIVVAGLAGAFYIAATYQRSPATAGVCPTATATTGAKAKPGAKPAAPKPAVAPPALAPSQVTVNVYNATTRAGLAADTAKLVRGRGYVVGTVSNDPQNKAVAGPAEIRFGPNGATAGALVQKLVAGSVPVKDARADASVDLVIGAKFSVLAPVPPGAVVSSPNC